MTDTTTIKQINIDSDEANDMLEKIEASFGIKFDKNELANVTTFGELCDIVANKFPGGSKSDCTTQQAFYKLRNAISSILFLNKEQIKTDTTLLELFPKQNRKQKIKELENELGFTVNILDIKQSIGWTIVVGLVGSLILFLFNWKIALSSLTFSIFLGWFSVKFLSTELENLTIGQLAEKVSRENYKKARRNPGTINKTEIAQKVKEILIKNLEINETALTRESTFV